jgi:DNA invertase Pin-like site-specific DNA recombinase
MTSICYGYGRHSTKKQSMTREVQESRTEDHYLRMLKPEGVRWGGFMYDPATSAGKPFSEREAGRQLFVMARPGDHIVVTKLDRLFRKLLDGVATIEQLEKRGVSIHALDYPIGANDAIGRLIRNLLLSMAELERELARERTEAVFTTRMEQGLPASKGCAVGWRICGEKPRRYYRVDEDERRMVRNMIELREAGESYDDIALWTMRQRGAKRTFPTGIMAKWAVEAGLAGWPKIGGYRSFFKLQQAGELLTYC